LFYSSVAGVTVSAAGAAVSVAAELFQLLLDFLAGPLFSCISFCQNLYQKVLQQLQL
jgi:hypothetical protein